MQGHVSGSNSLEVRRFNVVLDLSKTSSQNDFFRIVNDAFGLH